MSELQINYYKTELLSIKQKVTAGKSNIAKPVMLLTILKLIEDGHIIGNKILFDALLRDTYKSIFKRYQEIITEPVYPFYYLRNDGFYHIKGDTSRRTPSTKYVIEQCEYAYFDDGLWDILQDNDVLNDFKLQIEQYYLK